MSQVPRTQLLLAGEGPLRRRLESLAGELGLAGRVHFLGWRRDIARLFEASDISVFPSRYEPNGTVVMESWAHQKPLIASRSKGPQWLVDDGQNGLLFDVDAVDQLAEKIRLLQSDGALRRRLIEGGQQKWATSFSRDAVVGQYVRLFQRLTRKECPES
jgi:glycosyltransferase involved in cell wall biosynthesis